VHVIYDDGNGAVADARGMGAAKTADDLSGDSGGGNVPVIGVTVEEQVADAASDEVGRVAVSAEGAEHHKDWPGNQFSEPGPDATSASSQVQPPPDIT